MIETGSPIYSLISTPALIYSALALLQNSTMSNQGLTTFFIVYYILYLASAGLFTAYFMYNPYCAITVSWSTYFNSIN